MIDLIKAKLARGGFTTPGEVRLVVSDLVNIIEAQTEKLNELETKLDALARRSDRGSKKTSPKPEVRPSEDE